MKTLLGEHVLNMKKDEGDELPSIFPITSNLENWTIEKPLDELSEGYASDESWGVVMEKDVRSLEDQEEEELVVQFPPPLARRNFDLWDDWGVVSLTLMRCQEDFSRILKLMWRAFPVR